jgi:tetratricopeptide (TPR) repeat protein
MKFKLCLIVIFLVVASSVFASSRAYRKAMKLYEKGPAHVQELLTLLNKQLEKHPDDMECRGLLGVTYFSIGDFENALPQFDQYIKTGMNQGSGLGSIMKVSPGIMEMKLKTLLILRRLEEADQDYGLYWGFLSDSQQKDIQKMFRIFGNMDLVEKSINILKNNYKFDPTTDLFVVVDKKNIDALRKDSSGSIYIPDKLGKEPWSLVICLPENRHLDSAFHASVLWKNKIAVACAGVTKSSSVPVVDRKVIASHTKTISIPAAEVAAPKLKWQVVKIQTDDGTPVIAYKLVH